MIRLDIFNITCSSNCKTLTGINILNSHVFLLFRTHVHLEVFCVSYRYWLHGSKLHYASRHTPNIKGLFCPISVESVLCLSAHWTAYEFFPTQAHVLHVKCTWKRLLKRKKKHHHCRKMNEIQFNLIWCQICKSWSNLHVFPVHNTYLQLTLCTGTQHKCNVLAHHDLSEHPQCKRYVMTSSQHKFDHCLHLQLISLHTQM